MSYYKKSVLDSLTEKLAPVVRKISDISIVLMGTKTQVLKITQSDPDIFGDRAESISSGVINNVIISHPLGSNIRSFVPRDGSNSLTTEGLDLWDVLPFTMRVPFEGEFGVDGFAAQDGDLIVNVLYDENSTKIPLIFQVTKTLSGFMGKHLSNRKYELSLYRGEATSGIMVMINDYVDSL